MLDYDKVPAPHMVEGVQNYIDYGLPPGGFLTAVLENSLSAAAHADHINIHLLKEWHQFCYWELPHNAWGSREKVKDWISSGGQVGQQRERDRKEAS